MRAALPQLGGAILLFGSAWPITKAAMANATPMWFAASRAILACAVAMLLLVLLRRFRLPARADLPAVAVLGILQLGVFFALTHAAVALLPAGRTAVLSNVVTYWLIPLSVLLLGESVSRRRWIAAGVGMSGAAVLAGPWSVDWSEWNAFIGHAMLLAAGLSWSLAIIASRKWPPHTPMLELLPWCFAPAALLLVPLALVLEPSGGIGVSSWPYMLFIGLIAAPIGTWCVIEVGRHLPGAVSSVAFLLVPAFGVLISNLWLGEALGWDVILGGTLIVASVLLASL